MWRPDGKEIFFLTVDRRLMAAEVNVRNGIFEAGQVRSLFGPTPEMQGPVKYAVTADGQRFLLAVPSGQGSAEPLTLVQNWDAALKK
jgi:hypothetical protein